MANNRIAYGLAKEYGIDTKDKSPSEVWEALKGKGINQDNFHQYQYRQNEGYDKLESAGDSASGLSREDKIKKLKTHIEKLSDKIKSYKESKQQAKKQEESKPTEDAGETYRLSYSGEEIPLNKVETLVSKSISKSKWDTNFDDGMDMAIKDAAGELLDKYEDMSYEEAIDLATNVAEKVKKERSKKIERVATKEMIDVIKANPEARRVVNELLKNPNLTYDEAVILGYEDFMRKKG